jgi:hypothetical protein
VRIRFAGWGKPKGPYDDGGQCSLRLNAYPNRLTNEAVMLGGTILWQLQTFEKYELAFGRSDRL